jgi:hypothetical protein
MGSQPQLVAGGGGVAQASNLPQAGNNRSRVDLEALSKYVAESGILAYAIGTLTVNIYLHELGITDFSLAKPKLVLTGVVVLIGFLLLALFPIFVRRRISAGRGEENQSAPLTKKTALLLLLPLIGLIAASVFLSFKSYMKGHPGLGEEFSWKMWQFMNGEDHPILANSVTALLIPASIYAAICLAAAFASMAAQSLERSKSASTAARAVHDHVYFLVGLAVAVISFFGYIYIFSITFYPAISPAFGGGKPYYESFVVAEGERCQWQQLGIPFMYENSDATGPLAVLHESDSMVAVWLEHNPERSKPVLVQLDKSQISAVQMADPPPKEIHATSLPARCAVK